MLTSLTVAGLISLFTPGPTALCVDGIPAPVPVNDQLQEMYESGRSYTDFLDHATSRAGLWHSNTEKAEGIDPALVARARSVAGNWKFLAVAIDACSDSVSTIPYLAQLVALVDGLDMRVVDPTTGRSIMESHPTRDGRSSTPTVLLLDAHFEEAGCFIERPPELKTWILEEGFSSAQIYPRKMAWYDEDGGHHTVRAFVEMLEAAVAGGEALCR